MTTIGWVAVVVGICVCVLLGVFIGRDWFPPTPVSVPQKPVIVHDTVTLPAVHDTLPAVLIRDTIYTDTGKTIVIQTIASKDTVIGPYKDTLDIKYFFPPKNLFTLGFVPSPRPVQISYVPQYIQVPVQEGASFFEKAEWFVVGSATAIVINSIHK